MHSKASVEENSYVSLFLFYLFQIFYISYMLYNAHNIVVHMYIYMHIIHKQVVLGSPHSNHFFLQIAYG